MKNIFLDIAADPFFWALCVVALIGFVKSIAFKFFFDFQAKEDVGKIALDKKGVLDTIIDILDPSVSKAITLKKTSYSGAESLDIKKKSLASPKAPEAEESKVIVEVAEPKNVKLEETATRIVEESAPEAKKVEKSVNEETSTSSETSALVKTRTSFFSKLSKIFSSSSEESQILESLEELLVSSDIGIKTASELVEELRRSDKKSKESLKQILKAKLTEILESEESKEITPSKVGADPKVVMIVGVNGVGKTTSIGKLCHNFTKQGVKVLIAAADTFRAAAESQLATWAERAGAEIEIVEGENVKPSTVAYKGVHRAKSEDFDVLVIDTAGRLHTRVNLMNELESVKNLVSRELEGAPHEVLLVLDATTGQNALAQAKEFNARVKLSGLIVTKLDGTPKGGVIIAIKRELGVPVRYIGLGEGLNDLMPFNAKNFVSALLDESDLDLTSDSLNKEIPEEKVSEHAKARRRKRQA